MKLNEIRKTAHHVQKELYKKLSAKGKRGNTDVQ